MFRKTFLCLFLLTIVSALQPYVAEAQRAVPRRYPVARGHVYGGRPYYPVRAYYPRYYAPYYPGWYSGWYGGFGIGFGWYGAGWYGAGYGAPWYPYGYYAPYGYPYYGYAYDYAGSARLEMRPREAEVYIDGYLVGSVDDFDGWSQRLRVSPGEHELTVYLAGYRTYREKLLFRPGATIKITRELEPLAAGEPAEARPTPPPEPVQRRDPHRAPLSREPYPGQRQYPDPRQSPDPSIVAEEGRAGGVAIRVQPADAEILIDGERWESQRGGEERLEVQLSEGEHRIEVRREGYAPFTTTIRVRRGETYPLNVSLSRKEGVSVRLGN